MNTDRNKIDTQSKTTYREDAAVQIFPTNDDRLKFLGEIFSNKSSRKILRLLLEKELTITEISKKSGISANLVMHHLKKMRDSDIVTVTKETTNSRGHPLRFYRAKPAIVILSQDAASRAKTSKSLQKTLEKITRLGPIGLAGIVTWIFASGSSSQSALESAFKYPRPTLPPYMAPIEPHSSGDLVFSIIITASVVVAGFVINYMLKQIKK